MIDSESRTLADRFTALAARWHEETDDMSILSRAIADQNYLNIIGMGPEAVPLILADLEANGGYWYPALEALTCDSPETPEERETMQGMRDAWLRWGRAHGRA